MMQQFLILSLVAIGLLGPTAAAWCQGGALTVPGLEPQATGKLQAVMTTSELVVGQNRVAFGLLKEHQLLDEADVVVRVYELQGQQAQLMTQTRAPYARLEIIEQGKHVHIHPDGRRHVHNEATDVRGVYVTHVTFERPGPWGLEVLARQGDGPVEALRLTINVIAVRIADAIAQGKPQVIVFATPKFCTRRVCGPVVDVVRTLLPAYGDRVVFTHQEIWRDAGASEFSPTVVEWGLQTEPWIFVVDGKGIVRAKFEGLTTAREIEAALEQVLD
jgi:hypothetical protein